MEQCAHIMSSYEKWSLFAYFLGALATFCAIVAAFYLSGNDRRERDKQRQIKHNSLLALKDKSIRFRVSSWGSSDNGIPGTIKRIIDPWIVIELGSYGEHYIDIDKLIWFKTTE